MNFFTKLPRSRSFSKPKITSLKPILKLNNTIEWIVPNAQRNIMEPIRLTLGPGGTTYMDLPHEGERNLAMSLPERSQSISEIRVIKPKKGKPFI